MNIGGVIMRDRDSVEGPHLKHTQIRDTEADDDLQKMKYTWPRKGMRRKRACACTKAKLHRSVITLSGSICLSWGTLLSSGLTHKLPGLLRRVSVVIFAYLLAHYIVHTLFKLKYLFSYSAVIEFSLRTAGSRYLVNALLRCRFEHRSLSCVAIRYSLGW